MMVIMTCSLMVNGPGLSDIPKILTRGTTRAHARMRGKEISCATICGGKGEAQSGLVSAGAKARERGYTYAGDGDRGVAEEEELVEAGDDDGPEQADKPGAGGGARHVGVIGVGDGGAHLGVRRVVLCAGGWSGNALAVGQAVLTEVLDAVAQVGVVKLRGLDDDWSGGDGSECCTINRRERGDAPCLSWSSSYFSFVSWTDEEADMVGQRALDRSVSGRGRGGPGLYV